MPNDPWIYTAIHPNQFQHPDQMNPDFLGFLDRIEAGMGWFTKFTSDWRPPVEQAQQIAMKHGAAKHSLHEEGKAVDKRMPWVVKPDGTRVLDWAKLGSMLDAVCLYRKGIMVEIEIDITPNDPHIHVGWFGITGPLLLEPTCRHLGA